MTGREKSLLAVGALAGILVAGMVYGTYRIKKGSQTGIADRPSPSESQKSPSADSSMEGMKMGASASAASTANVELTPDEEKSLGLETVEVKKRNIKRESRSVGKVAEAENRQSTVSARVGGRIDRLLVRFTGESVRQGQPVASIYSPEIVSSAEEYRLSLENLEKLGSRASADAVEPARELAAASKRRLELWGLSQEQIREIEKGDAKIHLTIFANASGTVTERKVTEGQYVKEGDVLFVLSDLSRVWVQAEVYESDLPLIRMGETAELEIEGSDRRLQGRVNFIDPMVDQQTRTIPVRIEVSNRGMQLRPGMFVQVLFKGSQPLEALSVPRTAVVDTGLRKIVYVSNGHGFYEGREIEIGPAGEDFYPVLAGLKQGERVVTQGAFLVDSQTRLSGGTSGQFAGSKEYARDGSAQAQAPASGSQITLKSDPEDLRGGAPATFHVSVTDATGKTLSDAEVTVRLFMPAMPAMGMGAMDQSTPLTFHGSEYSGDVNIPTAGSWSVTVEAKRNGQRIAIKQSRMSAR